MNTGSDGKVGRFEDYFVQMQNLTIVGSANIFEWTGVLTSYMRYY